MGNYKKGRGAQFNTANSFAAQRYELDAENESVDDDFLPATSKTQFFEETPKQIISRTNSPDVGFWASINPYQGCEHGCIYCYARPTHEYWGFSAYAQHIAQLHRIACQKYLNGRQSPELTTALFRPAGQLGLFE